MTYEFKLRRDSSFAIKEVETGRIGLFQAWGAPIAGPLGSDDNILKVIDAFEDCLIPGTYTREVKI